MMSKPIVSRIWQLLPLVALEGRCSPTRQATDLHTLWLRPERMPGFVRDSAIAMHYLELLGPIDWRHFPERDLQRNWGRSTVPLSAFAAACLVKIDQRIASLARLRTYLVEHPPLAWLLGFPLGETERCPDSLEVHTHLPTYRHFTRMLRTAPNALMAEVERRLGFRPRYGALDAAFDAFYVYEYFHEAGGFAAVPLVEKGKLVDRFFSPEGLPLCAAGLAMPLKMTYLDRTTAIIPYQRGQYCQ